MNINSAELVKTSKAYIEEENQKNQQRKKRDKKGKAKYWQSQYWKFNTNTNKTDKYESANNKGVYE